MTDNIPVDNSGPENLLRHLQAVWAAYLDQTDFATRRAGMTFNFPGTGIYTFMLADTTYVNDDHWVIIEINGPNAAGTSTHSADLPRVRLEVDTLLGRYGAPQPGAVVLRCYSPDTSLKPEILTRVGIFADELERKAGRPVQTLAAHGSPNQRAVSVVHGDIPELAEKLVLENGTLLWKNAPVTMVFNSNVLSQVARLTDRVLDDILDELDPGVTQEGTIVTRVVFNKTAQQDLFVGTEIVPLAYRRAATIAEAAREAVDMAAMYGGAVIKPNATSGGSLVQVVDGSHTVERVLADIAPEIEYMGAKYGPGWERTCPVNVFQFAHGRPAMIHGRGHRWDLRWAVNARPDCTRITPLLARLCPEPIGIEITRGSAVCNLTRRDFGAVNILEPAQLLDVTGLKESQLKLAAEGLFQGLNNALRTR